MTRGRFLQNSSKRVVINVKSLQRIFSKRDEPCQKMPLFGAILTIAKLAFRGSQFSPVIWEIQGDLSIKRRFGKNTSYITVTNGQTHQLQFSMGDEPCPKILLVGAILNHCQKPLLEASQSCMRSLPNLFSSVICYPLS